MSKAKNQAVAGAEDVPLLNPELEGEGGQPEEPVAAASPVTRDAKQDLVKVRVLQQCSLGRPNDVVVVSLSDLRGFKESGLVDDDLAAVEYAESLTSKAV